MLSGRVSSYENRESRFGTLGRRIIFAVPKNSEWNAENENKLQCQEAFYAYRHGKGETEEGIQAPHPHQKRTYSEAKVEQNRNCVGRRYEARKENDVNLSFKKSNHASFSQ